MDSSTIAADIGMPAAAAATLADYEKQLDGAGRGDLSDEIDRLIKSPELQDVSLGKQQLAQGMLLLCTAKLENPNGETISSLPAGVRTPSDLMSPDKAHAKLTEVNAQLKDLKDAGITEGDQYDRLMGMQKDITSDLRETGALRDVVAAQKTESDEANKIAREQKHIAEYDELLGRTTRAKERLYPGNQEMAAKEAKAEVERWYARQKSGY